MSAPTDQELEQAFIDLMRATDGRGLLVKIGGRSLSELRRDLVEICGWFANPENGFPNGDIARISALRNLELLSRAYRLSLESGRIPEEPSKWPFT